MSEAVDKQDIIKGDPFGEISREIAEALGQLDKFDQGLKETAKSFSGLGTSAKKSLKDIDDINKAETESEKLLKQKIITQQTETKLLIEQERLKQASLRTEKLQNIQKQKTLTLYQQESRKLNELRNSYKELAVQNKENTREAKALLAQITPLDAKLKAIDKTVGQGYRTVGLYGTAFDGLKGKVRGAISVLGQLGVAFSGAMVVRSIIDTETELERLRMALRNVTKDQMDYAHSLEFINELALTYGQDLVVLTDTYKSFRASAASSGLAISEQDKIYQSIIKSGGALALTNDQIEGSLLAVSQMFSKGKVQAEELRGQLGERLPGAFGIMAKAIGVTEVELNKMLESGQIISKDVLPLFAEELERTFGDKAKENLNTISGAFNVLKTNLSNYFSEVNEGGRITRSFAQGLAFVGKNIGTIISVITKLIQLYIAFKVTMAALKLRDSAKDWMANRKAIKETGDALQSADDKAKGFGKALKSIGFAIAIQLAIELFMALKDIGSGAAQAEEDLARLNKTAEKAMNSVGGNIDRINKNQALAIAKINRELTARNITQDEFNLKQKEILSSTEAELLANQKIVIARKKGYSEDLKALRELTILNGQVLNPAQGGLADVEKILKRLGNNDYKNIFGNITAESVKDAMGQLIANIRGADVKIKAYREATMNASEATKDVSAEIEGSTKVVDENKKSIDRKVESAKKEVHELSNIIEKEKEYQGIMSPDRLEEILDLENQRARSVANIAEMQAELNLIEAQNGGNKEEIIKAEKELIDAKIVQIKLELELAKKKANSPSEIAELEKKAELEIALLTKVKDTDIDLLQERFEIIKSFQEAITQVLSDQIDARIALLKKEEDAAKSQQDYLEELAANGNITAKESITEAIEAQREAQAEQIRLERVKQNIELISAGIGTFNAQISQGKSPGEALASTITSTQVLVGFLKNIKFFEKGTDNAPEGMAVVDEKGAEIIADKKGNIKEIGTDKGARFTHLNQGDKVITAGKTTEILKAFGNIQNNKGMSKVQDVAGNAYDLLALAELKNISRAIRQNKSTTHVNWSSLETVVKSNKGGDKNTNRYRMK